MEGWFIIDEAKLLEVLGLPSDLRVKGVRWLGHASQIKLVLSGEDIPYPGGQIVSVNPVQTEKGLRDAAVRKAQMESEGRALLEDAERLS